MTGKKLLKVYLQKRKEKIWREKSVQEKKLIENLNNVARFKTCELDYELVVEEAPEELFKFDEEEERLEEEKEYDRIQKIQANYLIKLVKQYVKVTDSLFSSRTKEVQKQEILSEIEKKYSEGMKRMVMEYTRGIEDTKWLIKYIKQDLIPR